MLKFSQQMIDITEEAISNKLMPKDTDKLPAISYRDYEDAEIGWNIIKNAEKNCYIQFASNGAGISSYGFYKANNGEIYIIEAWANEITRVYIPSKDWHCLQDLINN
jgi:hypothetical protein